MKLLFSPSASGRRRPRARLVLLAICGLVGLAACGERQEARSSQVAARVGSGEVSIHQVNLVLQRQADLRPEQVEAASRTALERLIQLELAVQKAGDAKIDRDPQVVQAVDLARREVLARAYIDRLADSTARPTAQDIDRFYDERPALFKTRRLYSVQDIGIAAPADAVPALQTRLAAAKSTPALLAELADTRLPYTLNSATRPAEDWPLPLLDRLAGMKEGEVGFLVQPQGLRVLVLTAAAPAPRSLDEARASIEQFLMNERKQQKVDAELKALRSTAEVQYLGQFAQVAPAGAAATAPSPATPAAASATAAARAALDAEARNKGIQGLR